MVNRFTKDINKEFIKEVIKKYGSPVYVFDEASFIENYKNLQKSFLKYYPKYKIAYSYKTNYTPYVCKLIKRLGGYAEVVSDFEYHIAKKIGYDSRQIIYNGPYKLKYMYRHLIEGGINNIDNEQEAINIVKFARENKDTTFKFGLRVNIDIGQSFISRFGMDPKSAEFTRVLNMINDTSNCRIVGLHCHVGQSRGLDSWINRTERIIEIIDNYFNKNLLEYIDLGSGMFGDMEPEFKNQFENVPTYDEYAREVGSRIVAYYKGVPADKLPTLFTEPGATAISRYFFLATTVMSKKTVRGRCVAGLDSSFFNAGETCRYKKLPIKVFSNGSTNENIDLVGYTCLEEDVIYKNYKGTINVGDIVVFGNVGGYSTVFKPPFIMPDCASIVWKDDSSIDVIKRKQSYEDILVNYVL